MKRFRWHLLTGVVGIMAASTASATITVLDYYRLGDDDAGAVAGGAGNATTQDAVGGKHLTKSGSPTYSSNTTYAASTLSMANGSYTRAAPLSTLVDNWGIEASVYLEHLPVGTTTIAYNGGADGYGLMVMNAQWGALMQQVAGIDSGVRMETHRWVHLALVRTNGIATLYVDGVAKATAAGTPKVPTTGFSIGSLPGYIDEVRLFTFNAGEFNPATDLLANSTRTPDPLPLSVEVWYRCGEGDAGAAAGGAGAATTVDYVLGRNLSKTGTATYSADAAQQLLPGSTLAFDFSAGGTYTANNSVGLPADNMGVEAWVKPFSNSQTLHRFANLWTGGFALATYAGRTTWHIMMEGRSYHDTGVAIVPDAWVHLAAIRKNGVLSLYVNGIAQGATSTVTPNTGAGSTAAVGDGFNGLIDEVRWFTINPATFEPTRDLLLPPAAGTSIILQ